MTEEAFLDLVAIAVVVLYLAVGWLLRQVRDLEYRITVLEARVKLNPSSWRD